MNGLIGVTAFLIVVAVIVLIGYRVTRKPGEENPKRRVLREATQRRNAAERAMLDVEEIFNRYRTFIVNDPVAAPMADEVVERIRQYKTKTLELDQ